MYCIYCGKELPDEARFCMACGKAVAKYDSNAHVLPNDWRKRVVFTYFFSINGKRCSKGELDGKYGILEIDSDDSYQFITPLYDDFALPRKSDCLKNGDLYSVKRNGKWGVIRIPNEEVLPCVYDDVIISNYYFGRDFLVYFIKNNGKWGVNKYPNEEVLPCVYDDVKIAYDFGKLYYHLKLNEKWSVHEAVATKLKSFVFDDIEIISSFECPADEYKVRIKDKYGLYSYPDNEILPCQYDAINFIVDGLYKVMLNDKYGIVDEHNNEVVPIIFDDIIDSKVFSKDVTENNAEIGDLLNCGCSRYPIWCDKNNQRCYFIVKSNNKIGAYEGFKGFIIPLDYISVNIVYAPFIIVSKDNKKGLWLGSQEVLACEYDDICARYNACEDLEDYYYFNSGLYFILTQNHKFGIYKLDLYYFGDSYSYGNNSYYLPCVCDVIHDSLRVLCVKYDGEQLYFSKKDDIEDFKQKLPKLSLHKGNISPKYNAQYLFFDTETTGVPKNYKAPITDLDNWPRLVQLGWILTDEYGNEIDTGNDIIRPDGFVIPEAASNVHKITTEIAISKGESLSVVLKKFISACRQVKFLVGHNVSFDINVVGAELLRSDSNYSIASKASIDTMLKSVNYCAIPSNYPYGDKYKWPKLQELHKKLFGYEFEDAHDAMADIRATKKCFFELQRIGIITEGGTAIKQRSSSLFDDDLPF